jgi:transcriptional regulator with XRE-family HTH domain
MALDEVRDHPQARNQSAGNGHGESIGAGTFGNHLRFWRTSRGISQLELANRASSTSRYVSFIETGRSKPGEAMVERLAEALKIPVRERNDFMIAAGYQGRNVKSRLEGKTKIPFQRAVRYSVAAHQPFPSFAINRWYDIIEKNDAADAMFGGSEPSKTHNIVHSIFDDPDMKDRMENWATVAPAMACRLRREASKAQNDHRLQDLVKMAMYAIKDIAPYDAGLDDNFILCPTFIVGGRRVHTISMVARFGSTHDIMLDELRVETIFPRDAQAEGFFKELANGDLPKQPCWSE